MMPKNSRGFAPIVYLIAIAVVIISALFIKTFTTKTPIQPPTESASPSTATPSAQVSSSPKPTPSSNNKTKTSNPTSTPKTSPTAPPTSSNTPSTDASCNYNLSGPTGAVQVNIKPSSGQVVGDQIVELQAKSGCKVLDGRSSDKQTMIARAGGNGYSSQNSVTFSTVPAGSYSVRIQYKGQWTGSSGVDVVATQQKIVEFSVEGATPQPTPTPTPKPKPVCSILILPSTSGTAPFQASVCAGNNSPSQQIQQEFVDYTGDGSWDYQGPQYGCHSYTYQNSGTYTPKVKISNSDGEESDVCQTTVTVN